MLTRKLLTLNSSRSDTDSAQPFQSDAINGCVLGKWESSADVLNQHAPASFANSCVANRKLEFAVSATNNGVIQRHHSNRNGSNNRCTDKSAICPTRVQPPRSFSDDSSFTRAASQPNDYRWIRQRFSRGREPQIRQPIFPQKTA